MKKTNIFNVWEGDFNKFLDENKESTHKIQYESNTPNKWSASKKFTKLAFSKLKRTLGIVALEISLHNNNEDTYTYFTEKELK